MTASNGCPDLEALAAYLDGAVGPDERRGIEKHLASCEECCRVLAEAIRYRDDQRPKGLLRPLRTRAAWMSAAAAVLLAVTAMWMLRSQPPVKRGTAPAHGGIGSLASVLKDRRFVDARMTGGFPWAPLQPFDRSADKPRSTPSWEVLAAASAIRKEADSSPTTEHLHALGIAHFVLGDLDEAVSVLRRVAQESEAKAKPLSDLGAALLDRGERKGRPDDLVEALDCIEKSLRSDPDLGEALFNRAVAFEKLRLNDRAVAAWTVYLEHTSEPGWRDEAERRLERLKAGSELGSWERDKGRIEAALAEQDVAVVTTIVGRRTAETRLWIVDELMGEWAAAEKAERRDASEQLLRTAEALAEALFLRTDDPMPRDTVRFARESVSRPGASDRLKAVVLGRAAYSAGLENYEKFQVDEALPLLNDAQAMLSPIGDPVGLWASHAAARCEYYRGALDLAARRLDDLIPVAERSGYLALAAHAHWLKGLLDGLQGRFSESLGHYRRSLATFQRLGEEEHVAFLSSLLAEELEILGDQRESLRLDLDAVSRLDRVLVPGRAVAILSQTAHDVAGQGFPEVALAFQDAAVERALRDGDAIDAADSLLRRAPIAFAANHPESAARDIDESRLWVARVPDASLRRRLEPEFRFAEGQVARAGRQPRAAASVLKDAIEFFKKGGREYRLPALYLERAKALRASGDAAGAELDLAAGIELLETHRAAILEEGLRVSYFDTARESFDELVSLQFADGRPEAALATLERGKTRDLLDRMARAHRADPPKLGDAIPTGVVVIEYGVLPDRLLIWTLIGSSQQLAERSIRASEIAAFVERFRDELERPRNEAEPESGARLREILLDPIASRFGGAETVVFVPDDVLHAVPFSALRDPKSGRFLVEDRSVIVAPSVAVFLRASRRDARSDEGVSPSVLAVGDPAFDSAAFPYLPRLSKAADEARTVAKLYPDALVLVGAAATRARFLDGLRHFSVVHVAAHALGNEPDPLRSRLLLAPDPEQKDGGMLFAEDLHGLEFGSLRLVVLAACATASGRMSRGEGPLNLARPFLAGGVPAVVATLWDIEDGASTALLVRFHRGIAAGHAPEEALREAQRSLIGGADVALRAPRIWAAFELVGGVAPRPVKEERQEG